MRRMLLGALLALALSGCAGSHKVALASERALQAGSDAWDDHTDDVIADCRAQQLPTPEQREACVDDVQGVDAEVVAPAVAAAVAALRAYWLGVSVGESPAELARHLAAFADVVADLPAEYFGGLGRLGRTP